MKKSLVIAVVIGVIAIIVLGYLKFFSGYVSWSRQSQSENNDLNSCSETDNGKDYSTPGITKWTFRQKTYDYKDSCSFRIGTKTKIVEYYCTKEKTSAPASYDCASEGKTCKKDMNGVAYCG